MAEARLSLYERFSAFAFEAEALAAGGGETVFPADFAVRAAALCAELEGLSLDERAAYSETAGRVASALTLYIEAAQAERDAVEAALEARASAAYVCGVYNAIREGGGR